MARNYDTVRLSVLDYGAGNLHSLVKALERGGAEVRIERDPLALLDGDGMVLPGVGAFGGAASRLAPAIPEIRSALEAGYPCLGVCLGMQLLFDGSEESAGSGLGVLPGQVRRLQARRVPHMGWNSVDVRRPDPMFSNGPLVAYFANSFVADPEEPEDVIATAEYSGRELPAAVRRKRTWGVQFHPEKSGAPGLRLVASFVAEAARGRR